MGRTGIFSGVHPVSEARDLLLLRQHAADVFNRISPGLIDAEQHAHYGFIRPAVERTFKRSDGAGNCGVHIRQRGRRNPSCKSRSIQLVVGVKNQRHVQRLLGGARWLFPIQHQQNICRMGE